MSLSQAKNVNLMTATSGECDKEGCTEMALTTKDVSTEAGDAAFQLLIACEKGSADTVDALLHCGVDIECSDEERRTPLYIAASSGHVKVVELLLKRGANVNACDSEGASCLLTTVVGGHTAVVATLVSAGAGINVQRNDGESPLGVASLKGHIDIVNLLLTNETDVEIRSKYGATPLLRASRSGQTEVVKALLKHNADVDAVSYYRRRTPLCSAVISGHGDIAELLLENGANVDGFEGVYYNPLFIAALYGKSSNLKEMMELLIANGADVNKVVSAYGETVLFGAADKGRYDAVKLLVERGANVYARDHDNATAEDIARYCGHLDVAEFLSEPRESTVYLTASMNESLLQNAYSDSRCNTALHVARCVDIQRALLENGADVEAENVDGLRPIHGAVRTGRVDLVEPLIQHGANVDATDVFGNTPLHEAVCYGGLDVVQLLVQRGSAKVNVQNMDGKAPLHVAVERELSEVVVFLFTAGADFGLADIWSNTPLHYATRDFLLENDVTAWFKDNRLPNVTNAVGMSADHVFREISVNNDNFADLLGNTALHNAVGVYGSMRMFKVRRGIGTFLQTIRNMPTTGSFVDINAPNNLKRIALHVARGREAIGGCLQCANSERFLSKDICGRNFWHLLFLLRTGNDVELEEIISPFLDSRNMPGFKDVDDYGRTPLHYACMDRCFWINHNIWLPKKFIEAANEDLLNVQDKYGRTALHYAAISGHEHLRLSLIEMNVDETIQDNFKKTATEYRLCRRKFDAEKFHMRMFASSDCIAKKFRSLLLCFRDKFNTDKSSLSKMHTKLRCMLCSMRGNVDPESYVLEIWKGSRFEYAKVYSKSGLQTPADIGSQMFSTISRRVNKVMHFIAQELKQRDERFACDVVAVGSAYEETKIGLCDEFDFTFVLTNLEEAVAVSYLPESPPGFVRVSSIKPDYDKDFFNVNGTLNTRLVNFRFEVLVKQILLSQEFRKHCSFEFDDPDIVWTVLPRNASDRLNTHIKLISTKPVKNHQMFHDVSVDIVPAIRTKWPNDARRHTSGEQSGCNVVLTQPQRKQPWIGWTEPHCFLSFAKAESSLLRNSPAVVKAAFMAVKRMSQYFCPYEIFSTHAIKMAVLSCLEEQRLCRECLPNPGVDTVEFSKELLHWVQNILRRLMCFAAQDFVPSYFLPKCVQPVWELERHVKFVHMRLHRYGLNYSDLFSLKEEHSRDYFLRYMKAVCMCSHLMFWSVLSDTDELRVFVPSRVDPLYERRFTD